MYFSVKNAIKLNGKKYIPCVCYEVTKLLELTVEKLVKEGKAYTYGYKSVFVNGARVKPYEEQVAEARAENKKRKALQKEAKKKAEAVTEEPSTVTDEAIVESF